MPRTVRRGEAYTIDDDIELEEVAPEEEPPEEIQGEPWGWTKPGPKPRGWREDGDFYGA